MLRDRAVGEAVGKAVGKAVAKLCFCAKGRVWVKTPWPMMVSLELEN